MKKVFSVVLAGALFQVAFAETQTQNNEQVAQDSATQEVAVAPAKKENKLKDLVTNAKVSGFGFARFFTINGFDNIGQNGQSQQYRIKLDVTSGKIHGFSATAGLFFSQGSSTPDVGSNTNGAVQGGRGTAFTNNFSDRFNISQIFASKEFDIGSFSTKIDAGKINISSPLSDNKVDLGTGFVANAKQKIDGGSIKYHASFYDSWSGDHVGYNIRTRLSSNDHTSAAGVGIGNNLTLLGMGGNVMNKALDFNVYVGNIYGFMDFLLYGEAKYGMKLGDSMKLSILAQTSMAALNGKPHLYLGLNGKSIDRVFDTELANAAKFRGLYNIQAKLAIDKFSLKAGYLGSFGDGYGTLLDYKGGIDTAGKIWNGNLTATYEGLGMLGSGSFKNSSINVAYIAAEYGFKIPLKVGLDVAYVFGNTYMPELKVSPNDSGNKMDNNYFGSNTSGKKVAEQEFIKNASFFEITPHITYKFFDKLELSFLAATLAGDIDFFKTRTELKYTF
ncbi:MAG: hypothetical protein SPJ16_07220 [Helicobacter sp.]|uniref:hypothetical protein n=1 Tax=Helicobacter sp. TaxID=218 RepID=UPI002A917792|nr:hypothetical protein [Helicobacter sp.]MDY5950963.1 hypothetical protein [Helicobacter sp.]